MPPLMPSVKPEYTAALRGRRVLRFVAVGVLALVAAAVVLDHSGVFGYRGDDWASFDGRRFTPARISPQGFSVLAGHHDEEVRLLGVEPNDRDAPNAHRYLLDSLSGKSIILKLDPLQTRDAAGRLVAYVYLSERDCLNVEIVRAGHAFADRRQKHSMQAVIEAAEADARKHLRGGWKDVPRDPLP